MGKYIDLSAGQKEEIRRLTQLANRRIKNAFKAYEAEGKHIVPTEITGGIQTREQWEAKNYALSRSVKFESKKEYNQRLHFLRQFEHMRPGIKEYSAAQVEKTLQAVETSLGLPVPEELEKKIRKLNAPQLSTFWKKFSKEGSRLGMKYSSNAAMSETIAEFFKEDIRGLATTIDGNRSVIVKNKKGA
jgi:pyruvate dehydrogenase complex dehydrogenase (E1) component